jgi:hypothetical protein
MTLEQAVRVLHAQAHCDADWCVGYNGIGPHAFGITPGREPNIHLSADDAIRLAGGYEPCRRTGVSPEVLRIFREHWGRNEPGYRFLAEHGD